MLLHTITYCMSRSIDVYVTLKVIYQKYYKEYAYTLALEMSFMCLSQFLSKKNQFKGEIHSFLNFMLINFLVQTFECKDTGPFSLQHDFLL